ncbi:hypothetical protein C8R43DRAFT_1113750 [Mycena crocata]|nr:hypothetical protein C8R43DRAFT_1113750 [Mycena crocata]
MSLHFALDVILGITPVPGLSAAFNILKFIVSSIEKISKSKQQLEVLALSVAQLLQTLNTEFQAWNIIHSGKPLTDLYSLLNDIQCIVQKEKERSFLKALMAQDSRISLIEDYYRRIGTVANAFQISALLSIQGMISNDENARRRDIDSLHDRLRTMENNQMQLWQRLVPARDKKPRPRIYFNGEQHSEFTPFSPHSVMYNGKKISHRRSLV